jgi:HEAT repeat protein
MIRATSLALLTALLAHPAGNDIQWQTSFEKTLERAAAEKKVVFLAVNMDGEKANERMLEKVYTDKGVLELSKSTLNLVASTGEHAAPDKPCPKFPGLYCLDHKKTDVAALAEILKTDAQGLTVAPQNVFIGPDGKVILSVPYEINAHELTWCFVTALSKNDPTLKLAMPEDARMPRRLVLGGVNDPKNSLAGANVAPTKKELTELIKTLRKGTLEQSERVEEVPGEEMHDPEALDFVQDEMRSGGAGGGGGGGGGGRGGGGGGARGGGGTEKHKMILHAIGVFSPVAYWKLAADALEDHDASIRAEAAVALEQLAAPEAAKVIQTLLTKEEDPAVEKEMLRALGASGAADPKVRALLVKRAKSEKNELLRLNAILALGSCDAEPEVKETLKTLLDKGTDKERTAVVCAMALSRDDTWAPIVEAATKDTKDEALAKAAKTALTILKGGELRAIRESVVKIGGDKIQRERLFGRVEG